MHWSTARFAFHKFGALVIASALLAAGCAKGPGTPQSNPFATTPHVAPATATSSTDSASANGMPSIAAALLTPARDYVVIPDGRPFVPDDKRIEVVEVFGYVCPACAQFHPLVDAWRQRLPADVRLVYIPAPYGPEWIPYARGFYAADSLGLVDRTHGAVIDAIHGKHTLPGEGEPPSEERIARFYAGYGANEKEFLGTMHSFAVDAKIAKGKQFMIRSGVEGTPTLIIDGKYRVVGRTFEDMLRIASVLIDAERAARAQGTNVAKAP